MKRYTQEIFEEKLDAVNWFKVLNCDCSNAAWAAFKSIVLNILDEIAPVKEVRLKQRTEPWISSEILEMISSRDQCLVLFKKNKKSADYDEFKHLRNKVQRSIQKAKQSYFRDKIEEQKHCPKKNSAGLFLN